MNNTLLIVWGAVLVSIGTSFIFDGSYTAGVSLCIGGGALFGLVNAW